MKNFKNQFIAISILLCSIDVLGNRFMNLQDDMRCSKIDKKLCKELLELAKNKDCITKAEYEYILNQGLLFAPICMQTKLMGSCPCE